jgi:hypothetical protein
MAGSEGKQPESMTSRTAELGGGGLSFKRLWGSSGTPKAGRGFLNSSRHRSSPGGVGFARWRFDVMNRRQPVEAAMATTMQGGDAV